MALAWLQHSHDLLAVTGDGGQVSWANGAFCTITGWGNLPGHSLLSLLPAGPAAKAARQAMEAALRGEALFDADLEWQTRAGAPLWVRARVVHAADHTVWILRDITQAVAASREAEHQTELLDLAQTFGRLGVFERDIPSGEGRWDKHLFEFWGRDPSQAAPTSKAAIEQIHADDRAAYAHAFEISLQRAGNYAHRYRLIRLDGSTRWLHAQWTVKNGASGSPKRLVGVVMDDTEAFDLARSLLDATEQLKLAVDMSDIAVWRHDLKTQLMHYSDRACALLDMAPRPEGIPIAEVRSRIHPDDLPRVLASAQQTLLTHKPTDAEARYMRRDGTWLCIMTRRALQRSPSGEPLAFLGVSLDVTERVEATRQADELARRLSAAARAANMGIWTTTPTSDEPEWNDQMFELFDWDRTSKAPSLRQWVEHCVHPDDRARVWNETAAYLREGQSPAELEFRTLRRDRSSRWIVLRANVDLSAPEKARRLLGIALDVTEHREVLAALRSADQRAALAARSAGIGTWEADVATGVDSWDAQMFALRNLPWRDKPPTREERLALVHPDDAPLVLDSQRSALNADESSNYEFRVLLPDGTCRWLASRSIPVRDAQGNTVRRVGVNWDITESKNAQVAMQEKAVAERESQAKSQFLARMSHELRTPLNAVLGFTQLLQRDAATTLGDEQRSQLGHIRIAGEHLLSLINDALELSSVVAGTLKLEAQAVDLRALVAQALPLVESMAAQQQVRLHTVDTGDADPVRAWADPTRVLQVLLNLLSNAVKYNRPQGEVMIELRLLDATAQVWVTDTGRGMTPEQISHLFEPFNRLGIEHEGIEGTGIGLVIVKTLVEGMGGTLGVTSQAGRGTRFELRLPRSAARSAAVTTPAALQTNVIDNAALQRQGRLLYIEDNAVNVLLVQELVGTLPGLSLVSEATGHSGVQRAMVLLPDLILLDMQLPDFDGFEVLRRLRSQAETAAIPCIALSANAMPEDIERALRAGFEDYWTKPIDFRRFVSALAQRFPLQRI